MSLKVENYMWSALSATARTLAGAGDEKSEEHFGVHIKYEDLFASIIFFTVIWIMGAFTQRFLKTPCLVGEIFAGIVLGPPVLDYAPNPQAFVMLGEIGLILLVLEAGIDIDLTTLKLIGARGIIIAIIGSILPIAIAMSIAFALGVETKAAIAAGAAFGPTSLGIAMNILRQGKIVNTPVGQLIVSAAVIDDMIALIILSQLSALSGTVSVAALIVPIVSALAFLVIGGYISVYIFPDVFYKVVLSRVSVESHGSISFLVMMALLIVLMPATYYSKASFLMGAFIAGLAFCRSHEVHHMFVRQFKRLLQWLMRVFFAASIGFQVPVTEFGSFPVIWKGLVFTLALLGKIGTGLLVPNFGQTKNFSGDHLRDVLITGFSMAAEGEFAFVIAVFAVDKGIIEKDLYASIVLAVLISTIIPPFLLRYTISKYNKKAEDKLARATKMEFDREMNLESDIEITDEERDRRLKEGIANRTTVFLCIQTQSESAWGLLSRIMVTMRQLKLEIIDHRSWHPRGVDTTLVNEVFVKDSIELLGSGESVERLEGRMEEVKVALMETIHQEDAKVKVQRWFPGVLQTITEQEEVDEKNSKTSIQKSLTISDQIMKEAASQLENNRNMQTNITKGKSVQEILKEAAIPNAAVSVDLGNQDSTEGQVRRRKPRLRQKMRSTPVVGGGLFDAGNDSGPVAALPSINELKTSTSKSKVRPTFGTKAELIVNGEVFKVAISPATVNRMRSGYSGDMIDDNSIRLDPNDFSANSRLGGIVRKASLSTVFETNSEETTG